MPRPKMLLALVLCLIMTIIVMVSIVSFPRQQEKTKLNISVSTYEPFDGLQPSENTTDNSIPEESEEYIDYDESSIEGGFITELEEFSWTAMLLYNINNSKMVQYGCGGVLINRNFVLTAAHCVIDGMNRKRPLKFIRLREYDVHNDPDCMIEGENIHCAESKVDINPKNITIHPWYNVSDPNWYHDIALIEIYPSPPFSDYLRPVCLPEPELDNGMTAGNELVVSGWGRTSVFHDKLGSNAPSPVKLKVDVPFVEREACKKMLNFELGSGQICAGGEIGKDACLGDSGSPLMHYDTMKDVMVLTGIVSMGKRECGTEGIPGVYTNIREYLDWIKCTARMATGSWEDTIGTCGE